MNFASLCVFTAWLKRKCRWWMWTILHWSVLFRFSLEGHAVWSESLQIRTAMKQHGSLLLSLSATFFDAAFSGPLLSARGTAGSCRRPPESPDISVLETEAGASGSRANKHLNTLLQFGCTRSGTNSQFTSINSNIISLEKLLLPVALWHLFFSLISSHFSPCCFQTYFINPLWRFRLGNWHCLSPIILFVWFNLLYLELFFLFESVVEHLDPVEVGKWQIN